MTEVFTTNFTKVLYFTWREKVRQILSELGWAISFLSRIPIGGRGNISKVPSYFSVVGYFAGATYFIIKILFPSFLGTIFAIALGFSLFDLFHFDGFLDTMDGFFSQKTASQKMEIMIKGNIGPSALFWGILYMITYITLFWKIKPFSLFYMAIFGRLSMNFLMDFSQPAKNTGLGKVFYPYDHKNTLFSLIFTLPMIAFPKMYFLSLSISLFTAVIFNMISKREIGGYTGDVLGCVNMLSQIFILSAIFSVNGG